MSAKPNSQSVLKNLTAERQEEIFQRMTVNTAEWPDTSYRAVRRWLKDDGLVTSEAALSEFYSWYALRQQLKRNESTVETMLADLKKFKPELTAEEMDRAGQLFFTALAIQEKDSLTFSRIRADKRGVRAQELESRKIALLEKKAAAYDRAQAALTDAKNSKGGITPETLKRIETELRLL
jgi:hypothetical protein